MRKILLITSVIILTLSILLIVIGCKKEAAASNGLTGDDSSMNEPKEEEITSSNEKTDRNQESKPPEYRLLYQLSIHSLSSHKVGNTECFILNFSKFLDGGIIKADGSENDILDLNKLHKEKI